MVMIVLPGTDVQPLSSRNPTLTTHHTLTPHHTPPHVPPAPLLPPCLLYLTCLLLVPLLLPLLLHGCKGSNTHHAGPGCVKEEGGGCSKGDLYK